MKDIRPSIGEIPSPNGRTSKLEIDRVLVETIGQLENRPPEFPALRLMNRAHNFK